MLPNQGDCGWPQGNEAIKAVPKKTCLSVEEQKQDQVCHQTEQLFLLGRGEEKLPSPLLQQKILKTTKGETTEVTQLSQVRSTALLSLAHCFSAHGNPFPVLTFVPMPTSAPASAVLSFTAGSPEPLITTLRPVMRRGDGCINVHIGCLSERKAANPLNFKQKTSTNCLTTWLVLLLCLLLITLRGLPPRQSVTLCPLTPMMRMGADQLPPMSSQKQS